MPTADELKDRIEAAIPGSVAHVDGADGQHFSATVVAPEFAGLSRLEQHRRVMAVFGDELGGRIHALALSTRPE